jgi:hypothetical protein
MDSEPTWHLLHSFLNVGTRKFSITFLDERIIANALGEIFTDRIPRFWFLANHGQPRYWALAGHFSCP